MESAIADHESFPLVIADPPWVPRDQLSLYPQDPELAIDGGRDGLQLARACTAVIDRHLRPEGRALLQLGSAHQVRLLDEELAEQGLRLTVAEHRAFPRGNLVLLERPAVTSAAS